MISEESGSLLDAPADALVNTVNTVGIMGMGLALPVQAGLSRQLPCLPGSLPEWRGQPWPDAALSGRGAAPHSSVSWAALLFGSWHGDRPPVK